MSIMRNIKDILRDRPGLAVEAGRYPEVTVPQGKIVGKVIFAGGMNVDDGRRPRNIMGGDVLDVQLFKVILCGANYIALEEAMISAKVELQRLGYMQISGIEHLDPIEKNGESLLQLAVTFKATKN